MLEKVCTVLSLILWTIIVNAQVTVEGYVFQENNRGFLNRVDITILDQSDNKVAESMTNLDGFFSVDLPANQSYYLFATKEMFIDKNMTFDTKGKSVGEKVYLKVEMHRAPGYTFEITLAEARENEDIPVDAIRGARIEVYNNTTEKEELVLTDHPHPDFQVNLIKGNHYTILIRKDGYLAKRMEAYVDVEGCILCFEGVGEVKPGISDNLTEGNEMGVLLANVELEKVVEGKSFEINNLYYDYAKWDLTRNAKVVLDNVITIFKDNPNLLLELGSHTDSRGKADKNRVLSQKRAQSAVAYLKTYGNISDRNIIARGYGESKLVNNCKDGVDCTEAQHAKNRRTELTILGTVSNYEFKSLAQLKEEEKMEALIKELQNQEQVKVKEGEDLEKKLEAADEKTTIPEELSEAAKEAMTEKAEEKETISSSANATKETMEASVMEEKVSEATKKSKTMSEKTGQKQFSNGKEKKNIPGETVKHTSDLNYQVIIHYGTVPLEDDHAIRKEFPNINEYKSPQHFVYYSIGKFSYKEEAEAYMMKNLIDKYPTAYVSPYYGNVKGK